MLRRSTANLLLNNYGASRIYSINNHQESLADSLLLLDWKHNADALQSEYKRNFLPVRAPDTFVTPVITPSCGSRLATCCVVTVADEDGKNARSRWVPFIVDTGAPSALYLSAITWDYLDIQASPRKSRADPIFCKQVQIGKWSGSAFLSEEHGETATHLADVNVIGMALLGPREIAESMTGILQRALEPTVPNFFLVLDARSGATSPVSPKRSTVMFLKDAIKEKYSHDLRHIDAPHLIIKDSNTGLKLGDEDPVHASIKYIFEVPEEKSTNKL